MPAPSTGTGGGTAGRLSNGLGPDRGRGLHRLRCPRLWGPEGIWSRDPGAALRATAPARRMGLRPGGEASEPGPAPMPNRGTRPRWGWSGRSARGAPSPSRWKGTPGRWREPCPSRGDPWPTRERPLPWPRRGGPDGGGARAGGAGRAGPVCPVCGGTLKSGAASCGQPPCGAAIRRAEGTAQGRDRFLAGGWGPPSGWDAPELCPDRQPGTTLTGQAGARS